VKKYEVHAQFEPNGRFWYIMRFRFKWSTHVYIWRSKRTYHKTTGPYLVMRVVSFDTAR